VVSNKDLKAITKVNGWQFDWKLESNETIRTVYKLTIQGNSSIV
jgi:hypothetical protein